MSSHCMSNMYTVNIFGAINTNRVIQICGTTIKNFRYADDITLLDETEQYLQDILNEVNRTGERTFGMKMIANKTKSMQVSIDVTLTKVTLKLDGDIIQKLRNIPIWGKL